MAVNSFRDLRVWQVSMDMVGAVYTLTRSFPREELYGLAGQMRRAAVSIPSNIAEGHTREHSKEYLNYLSMAQASLAELETQIEIASRLNYVSQAVLAQSLAQVAGLRRQLFALRNALVKRMESHP
ncbi:MAG: four helix bundle protein [Dehalococcoidia bacterium]|nr:four helix bundle protein [Dehalococcoidia bacterium]